MASRKEEKERRKQERLDREKQAEESTRRRKLVAIVAASGVAIAAIVVLAVVVIAGNGNDKPSSGSKTGDDGTLVVEAIKPPEVKVSNLDEAAEKAGCVLKSTEDEGNSHIDPSEPIPKYKSNPPVSGDHDAEPLEDAAYGKLEKKKIKNALHSLEHGRVIYQYRGISDRQLKQLKGLYDENTYHVTLMENVTKMPYQVAGAAWNELLLCKKMDSSAFDALRAFRDEFVDKGPELVK